MAPPPPPPLSTQCLQRGTALPSREENPISPAPSEEEEGPWASRGLPLCCCPSAEPVPFHCSLSQGLTSRPVKRRVSAVSLPKVPTAPILLSTCQPSEVQTILQSQCGPTSAAPRGTQVHPRDSLTYRGDQSPRGHSWLRQGSATGMTLRLLFLLAPSLSFHG